MPCRVVQSRCYGAMYESRMGLLRNVTAPKRYFFCPRQAGGVLHSRADAQQNTACILHEMAY